MTPIDVSLRRAWTATDRRAELNRVVERLADAATQQELEDALGRLLDAVRAGGGPESDEDIVLDVADRLTGWCLPANRIHAVPPPTPNGPTPVPTTAHRLPTSAP